MKHANGKLTRFTAEEIAAMTRAPTAKTDEQKREAIRRATTGLRAGVRVTRSMYRPR